MRVSGWGVLPLGSQMARFPAAAAPAGSRATPVPRVLRLIRNVSRVLSLTGPSSRALPAPRVLRFIDLCAAISPGF